MTIKEYLENQQDRINDNNIFEVDDLNGLDRKDFLQHFVRIRGENCIFKIVVCLDTNQRPVYCVTSNITGDNKRVLRSLSEIKSYIKRFNYKEVGVGDMIRSFIYGSL